MLRDKQHVTLGFMWHSVSQGVCIKEREKAEGGKRRKKNRREVERVWV
jgi:hypothetical protein